MTLIRKSSIFIALACLSMGSYAQTAVVHSQHHPEVPIKNAPKPGTKAEQMATMADMDRKMEAMRDMHEKMMAAKTPEERNALMADHMKSMKDGMSMMGTMGTMGNMGMSGMDKNAKMPNDMASRQMMMMEKRMDMMQGMMQMMMDRMPAPAAK